MIKAAHFTESFVSFSELSPLKRLQSFKSSFTAQELLLLLLSVLLLLLLLKKKKKKVVVALVRLLRMTVTKIACTSNGLEHICAS